jgi:hypothetical protein
MTLILRKYLLAITCIIAPFLFANFGVEHGLKTLFPDSGKVIIWQPRIETPSEPKRSEPETKALDEQKLDTSGAAKQTTDATAPANSRLPALPPKPQKVANEETTQSKGDPRVAPLVLQITGRHRYAAVSSFLYAACGLAFAAGFATIWVFSGEYFSKEKRFQLLRGLVLACVAVSIAGIGWAAAPLSLGNAPLRNAMITNIVAAADLATSYCAWVDEVCDGSSAKGAGLFGDSGKAVTDLIAFNARVGMIATITLLFGVAACAIRAGILPTGKPPVTVDEATEVRLTPSDLKIRGQILRLLLFSAALVFLLAILTSKAALDWPAALVAGTAQTSVREMGDSLLTVWSTAFTLVHARFRRLVY